MEVVTVFVVAAAAAVRNGRTRLVSIFPSPLHVSPAPFLFLVYLQLEGFDVPASALDSAASSAKMGFSGDLVRTSDYMTHPVFNTHHSEVCHTHTKRATLR